MFLSTCSNKHCPRSLEAVYGSGFCFVLFCCVFVLDKSDHRLHRDKSDHRLHRDSLTSSEKKGTTECQLLLLELTRMSFRLLHIILLRPFIL